LVLVDNVKSNIGVSNSLDQVSHQIGLGERFERWDDFPQQKVSNQNMWFGQLVGKINLFSSFGQMVF